MKAKYYFYSIVGTCLALLFISSTDAQGVVDRDYAGRSISSLYESYEDMLSDRPSTLKVNQQNNMQDLGNFSVGPTSFTLHMNPGEERTLQVQLTNREGELSGYRLLTEDFDADDSLGGAPRFHGVRSSGPYPARDWIEPEIKEVALRHGERAFISIKVRVPEDSEPGDHQAALIVEKYQLKKDLTGGFNIIPRVAALFIITVRGEVVADGQLTNLSTERFVNWAYPVNFTLEAINNGTIHIQTTGNIVISNIFGITVDEIPIREWYVLRNSLRTRHLSWNPKFALGYYNATTDLQLVTFAGGLAPEQLSTSFWVIPIFVILIAIFAIFLVSYLVQIFFSNFELRRKRDDKSEEGKKKEQRGKSR
ncbi:hypothetical protein KJ996_04635 [Patescibacteria group bacterium]|nr:hypothetical protein [Patescibacteria group bacterium]